MPINHVIFSEKLKVLADPTRTKILEILSCGERCACDLQPHFTLSQPTLSYHLNALVEADFIRARKEGKWVHYRLKTAGLKQLARFVQQLLKADDDCVCHTAATGNKRITKKTASVLKECSNE